MEPSGVTMDHRHETREVETASFRFNVPADVLADLRRLAAASDRSTAAEARRALRQYCEASRYGGEGVAR